MKSIDELFSDLDEFVKARQWEKFHTARNLATCLSVEASELLELYQWQIIESRDVLGQDGGPPDIERVEEEIGDIMISLANFCRCVGINPINAAFTKLEKVKEKYPVEQSRGSAAKPTREQ